MLEPRMHRYVLKHSKGQRSETCGLKKSVPLNIFFAYLAHVKNCDDVGNKRDVFFSIKPMLYITHFIKIE